MMPTLLDGIRVIDWTVFHQGPCATAWLADLGAEVIKLEQPSVGDPRRGQARVFGIPQGLKGGRNLGFELYNRNKKGIAIDLTKPEGRGIAYRLVARSDVFVHNFRQRAVERLGMTYEDLRPHNPKLIYAFGSGYGSRGADSSLPALDPLAYARSGMMVAMGSADSPSNVLPGMADAAGAMMLALGIIGALFHRERTGVGQKVEASILAGILALQTQPWFTQLLTGHTWGRQERETALNPLYNYYKCKDSVWICLALLQSDRHWPTLCAALGIEKLERDPRFVDAVEREHNCKELVSILSEVFITRTYDEWAEMLKAASDDLLFTKIQSYQDLTRDQQIIQNELIVDFVHPVLGKMKMPGFPVHFSETPTAIRDAAPEIGQHTEEVLTQICGYSWGQVVALKEQEAIP